MAPFTVISLVVVACSLCSVVVTASMLARLWTVMRGRTHAHRETRAKLGEILVMRAVFCITASQLLTAVITAVQYFPDAVGYSANELAWEQSPGLCKTLGVFWQFGYVSEFAWALLLVWMLLMLLRGYSSVFLDRTAVLQHAVIWVLVSAITLSPLISNDYGFNEGQCWLMPGPYRYLFYGLFFFTFACCVLVITVATCRRHSATRTSFFLGFLLYFFVIWVFPIVNRTLHLCNYNVPQWMVSVETVVESADGMGSFLVWVSLLRKHSKNNSQQQQFLSDAVSDVPNPTTTTQLARRLIDPTGDSY